MRSATTRVQRRWLAVAFLLLACGGGAQVARAADTCTVTAQPVAFGVYDPISITPATGTVSISVECTGNPHDVLLRLSTGGSGTYAQRRMTVISGTATLGYNLYVDPTYTQVFGDGTGGSATVQCKTGANSGGCTGSNPSGSTRRAVRPVYGRLPAGQDAAPGNYRDTIRVDVIF